MKNLATDVLRWQRDRLIAGECLGTLPDTYIVCGEAGSYCSMECRRRSEAQNDGYLQGVRDGFAAATTLVDRALSEMLEATARIAETSDDERKRVIAQAVAIVLGDLRVGLREESEEAMSSGQTPSA